eukprot:g32180.t1
MSCTRVRLAESCKHSLDVRFDGQASEFFPLLPYGSRNLRAQDNTSCTGQMHNHHLMSIIQSLQARFNDRPTDLAEVQGKGRRRGPRGGAVRSLAHARPDGQATDQLGLHGLQYLNLSWCQELTDAGLIHLTGLGNLRHLDLSFCHQLTDAGLVHLAGLRSLEHLNLRFCYEFTSPIPACNTSILEIVIDSLMMVWSIYQAFMTCGVWILAIASDSPILG